MTDLGYIRMAQVPEVPRLAKTLAVTLTAARRDPDGAGRSDRDRHSGRAHVLLHEAGASTGISPASLLGRPTCMAIPAALTSGIASSLGCVGNGFTPDLRTRSSTV